MSDDLKDLKAAMDAATPRPDPARRAANLRLAQENFERLQGSGNRARPTSDRHPLVGWLLSGGRTMIHTLSTRGGLVATTALAAIGLVIITPQGRSLLQLPSGVQMSDEVAAQDDGVRLRREQDAVLRGDTADLLGRIGHRAACDSLRALLDDPNPHVAEIAGEALEEIDERDAD